MIKIITISILLFIGLAVQAQVPVQQAYPAAPAALANITNAEVFVGNTDPGIGNATPIALPTGTNVSATNTTINFAALPNGVHYVYVRSRDAGGEWSLTNFKLLVVGGFNYPAVPSPSPNLTALEAYVGNTDPNFGNGTIFPITGTDVSLNSITLNFPALPNGVQFLYVRSRDAGGEWSITNSKQFIIGNFPYPPTPPTLPNLTALEVFVGSPDPSFGNGTILPIAGADVGVNNATINFPAQPNGLQYLYVRSRDVGGEWSITNYKQFIVGGFNYPATPAVSPNLTRLEYFTGATDPGFGNGTNLPIPAGNDASTGNTTITIPSLPDGNQSLYVRSRDAGGEWSLTNFQQYIVGITGYSLPPAAAPAMANLEYYVDTDPGFGNGTPITFAPSTDVQLTNIPVTISGLLADGAHIFHIRSKQNPWALDNAVTFNVGATLPVTWLYVKAQLQNGNGIVNWATTQETNTSKFEVEWSINGIQFSKLGEVTAAGNSSVVSNYTFNHNNLNSGFNFYRIKQIDANGNFKYSTIVKILNNKNLKQTIIAPNPVADVLQIIEPQKIMIKAITIVDSKGATILQKTINAEDQVISIPVSHLANGQYIVKIQYHKETKSYGFIKQ